MTSRAISTTRCHPRASLGHPDRMSLRVRLACLCALVAGCVAHAAPPPAAPAPGSVPPPAGNVTFVATEGDRAECHPGQSCQLACPHGGCDLSCAPGATCQVSCDGGGCAMACAAGATCAFSCNGGGCEQSCAGNACAMTCAGGGCEVEGSAVAPPQGGDGDHDDDGDDDRD